MTKVKDDVLREALIELQSASWSRSWKRVKAARKLVKELVGFDVTGPLTAALEQPTDLPGTNKDGWRGVIQCLKKYEEFREYCEHKIRKQSEEHSLTAFHDKLRALIAKWRADPEVIGIENERRCQELEALFLVSTDK
jgi:hypothetical protein